MDTPSPRLLPDDLRRDWITDRAEPIDPADAPTPEHVALLAEDRLDLVPADRRDALLRAVATDPVWADVLRGLRERAAADQPDAAPEAPPVIGRVGPDGATGPLHTFVKLSRWTLRASALAACLGLSLGAWSFLSPTPEPGPGVRSGLGSAAEFPWRELLSALFFLLSLMLLAIWSLQAYLSLRGGDE